MTEVRRTSAATTRRASAARDYRSISPEDEGPRYRAAATRRGLGAPPPPASGPSPYARVAWRVGRWAALGLAVVAVLSTAGLAGLFAVYGADEDLPDVTKLKDHRPKQVTRVLAADGSLLGEIFEERRTWVPYARLPKVLVDAVVAAEDARFFSHTGLNVLGMVRALLANLKAGRYVQGGSTITQQVVKTYFFSSRRTMRRKVQEVILARRLEQTLSKEQILELYLNHIYFGHQRYGVQEASRFYFGKDVEKIGLHEASLLGGLPQGPERLSPVHHPDRAKRRQKYVLKQLVRGGKITQAQADAAAAAPLPLTRHDGPAAPGPEFVTLARHELLTRFGAPTLPQLGQTVTTTCDLKLQIAAREAVEKGLRELDQRLRVQPSARPLGAAASRRLLAELRQKQTRPLLLGRVYQGVVTAVDDERMQATLDLGGVKGVVDLRHEPRYNPERLPPSRILAPRTAVRVALREPPPADPAAAVALRLELGPQAAVIVLDVATRDVKAMVGGYGYRVGDFNRALQALRQPGSTFKPIVYAAALEASQITAAELLPDAPHACENWLKIRQGKGKEYAGQMTVRRALALSVNSVACRVYERAGSLRVRTLARHLGIRSPLGENLALALGAAEVRPVELAGAFAAFAGGGLYRPPRFFKQLGSLPMERPEATQALRAETAFIVTSLLTSVVQSGTGTRARRAGRPVAGKTGTSNQSRDAWFVGYTPELVIAVWVGYDDFVPLGGAEGGGRTAAPFFAEIARHAGHLGKGKGFTPPPGIVTRMVDPQTGRGVAEGTKGAQREYFLPGTAPEVEAAPAPEVDPGDHVTKDDEG
jgi:penicillin-binding protein 1A